VRVRRRGISLRVNGEGERREARSLKPEARRADLEGMGLRPGGGKVGLPVVLPVERRAILRGCFPPIKYIGQAREKPGVLAGR